MSRNSTLSSDTSSDIVNGFSIDTSSAVYSYKGRCPKRGNLLKLPRTRLVEAIAQGLMQQLAIDDRFSREGKMYGVLLVKDTLGQPWVLKAFSGLLNGESQVEGWVPPIPGREQVALDEAQTLSRLNEMKQQLIALQHLPERQQYEILSQEFEIRLKELSHRHSQRKYDRQSQRGKLAQTLTDEALLVSLEALDEQSRQDGIERRDLKRQRDARLKPLKQIIDQANSQMQKLKRQRKALSQALQAQMHAAYWLTNFSGESRSLQHLMPKGFPTGTGDCCAPKLLHYAATQGLTPLAMAEFWWGAPTDDKIQGEFYGACRDRCQPLMGFLLSGLLPQLGQQLLLPQVLSQSLPQPFNTPCNLSELNDSPATSLPILYQDDCLIVVNKPSGLLSVPGRYSDTQDSVLSRLQYALPNGAALKTVHRLDRDTSGLLVLARNEEAYRCLSQQFEQRRVHKIYEAVLAGCARQQQGVIELPLWSDPDDRPRQKVDWQQGKPSITRFQVIDSDDNGSRVEFVPITGRTHQLRVHAADSRGLGVPILGDRLYGDRAATHRLHLHARQISFTHPRDGRSLHFQTETPFWT
jgi:tRNA pseudouridine32 synthase/23S rRNA pseudouridine746 synthase